MFAHRIMRACALTSSAPMAISLVGLCISGCGSGSAPPTPAAPHSASLISLSVAPLLPHVLVGQSIQLSVTGTYSDQSQKDLTPAAQWSTSDAKVASIDASGRASCVSLGQAVITAGVNGVVGSTTVTVEDAVLTSIVVTPPTASIALGLGMQLSATGTYSDNNKRDITALVGWQSSQPATVTVSTAGSVLSKSIGTATITATLGPVSGSNQVTVAPAAPVSVVVTSERLTFPVGATSQFAAKATFTDSTTQDVTGQAAWSSSSPGVVSIAATGLATAKAAGAAAITATLGTIRGAEAITISAATLNKLQVTSSTAAIPLGLTAQFVATGQFSDGSTGDLTTSVTWASSPPGLVSVSSSGIALSHAKGEVTITASSGSVHAAASLTVLPAALKEIQVSSATASLPLGASEQLVATGHFTDGIAKDVTTVVSWATSNTSVMSITNTGEVTAVSQGTATISAWASGADSTALSGSQVLQVSPPQLAKVYVSPDKAELAVGSKQQLRAVGVFTDGSKQDITSQGVWTAAHPPVATVSENGVTTARSAGTTMITSTYQGIIGAATVTVDPWAAVTHYTNPAGDVDSTIRIINPGTTGAALCVMLYVFDQNQAMNECCGCAVSPDALRTLSLKHDLVSNPLTGVRSAAGSLYVIPADYATNTTCDPSSIRPVGVATAWATHLESTSAGELNITEDALSPTLLPSQQSKAIQAECSFVQQLGGGQGICTCGSGK